MITGAVALRNAVSARVRRVPGLREANGVLGPEYEPKQVVDRSYTVLLAAETDAGGRVRTDGSMVANRELVIRLAHKINAARGHVALEVALRDAEDVKRIMLGHVEDDYRDCEPATRYLETPDPEIAGGGTFYLTNVRFRTRYIFTIEPLPG